MYSAHINVSMGHGANDGNIGILLQRQNIIVVLKEHNALRIKLTGNLLMRRSINILEDVVISNASIRLLEKAQLELGAKHARNSSIQDTFAQFAGFNKGRDRLVAVISTAHLNIVTGRQSLNRISFFLYELYRYVIPCCAPQE